MALVSAGLQAALEGDFSARLPANFGGAAAAGEQATVAEVGVAFNRLMGRLAGLTGESARVQRLLMHSGTCDGPAVLAGASGAWGLAIAALNDMAEAVAGRQAHSAEVVARLAEGDLSQTLPLTICGRPLEGAAGHHGRALNALIERLRVVSAAVSRVARQIGMHGELGSRAQAHGLTGTWRAMTDDVNFIADNLTAQVRDIAAVTTAVAGGDLSRKVQVEARGEICQLKDTVNTMVERLRSFAAEVTRVAQEVGTQGKLGGQAQVSGMSGTWKDLTDSVNQMASNLTAQVRNIAQVTTAVAGGDLSRTITVEARGEVQEVKNTVNTMVEQLRSFAAEVTRVAREVGSEGKLGGQANVEGISGTWRALTDNVNLMARNLTLQVRGIACVVTAVAEGDLSMKLSVHAHGEIAALADTINHMTHTLGTFAAQVTTVAREVGIDGKLGGQARVPGAAGTWRQLTDSVNMLAGNLTAQVRAIAKVTIAVADGDLSQQIAVDAQGEMFALKDGINRMVERLRTFAAEVTRVAREVGTDGKLGGQAQVPGVAGTWKDLTENVNVMASNLTGQVRSIDRVVTAVAHGDLTRRVVVQARGEIALLADTINAMTDTLRTFASQVTGVAREVGLEGRLGGQAEVPGAAGTWRDLTVNVNQLAGNLTAQVRAIAEVAGAVTEGDLTRTIDVEARGEVLALKDTINRMIANLHDTTLAFRQQDWLKTNLARFSQMMQGQRSSASLAQLIMNELSPLVSAQYGSFFVAELDASQRLGGLRKVGAYAPRHAHPLGERLKMDEGLVGQCAAQKRTILVSDVPPNYMVMSSSLGAAAPRQLLLLPVLFEGTLKGVIELGSCGGFSSVQTDFLEQVSFSIGVVLNTILAGARTEGLLVELQGSHRELEERSSELEEKASLLELKNNQIAQASASLEDKAAQLALVSKYKSDFLANMSHELRTPLNSLLILARLLADNEEDTLTPNQVRYAETIDAAGHDLLALISQILDLSKIEAGRLEICWERVEVGQLCQTLRTAFEPIAQARGLDFSIVVDTDVPLAFTTDHQRICQVLKNLLSNAFKFTSAGGVVLTIGRAEAPAKGNDRARLLPGQELNFAVHDTGVGISPDKLHSIFDAFVQADTSTSRMFGGTGLGLTISRELAALLSGEIDVESDPTAGTTFTLRLPISALDTQDTAAVAAPRHPLAEAQAGLKTISQPFGSLSGRRALLVDDDARNLFAVTALLEKQGMQVLAAGCAQEALDGAATHPPFDIVLMDLMLPGMDGLEAIAHLRTMPEAQETPIVALTANAQVADHERCMAAGCRAVVIKPVEAAALLHVIVAAVRPASRDMPRGA